MIRKHRIVTGAVFLLGFTAGLQAQEPGFGEEAHRAFGDALWERLGEQNLVGEGAITGISPARERHIMADLP